MGKLTCLSIVVVGLSGVACGDDGAADADALIVVTADAPTPDAPVPDAAIPDAPLPDADLTSAPPAFRVTKLWLRDPHVFTPILPAPLSGFSCTDVTDTSPIGFSANGQLQQSIDFDGTDMDTYLDLSLIADFDPLDTTDAATGNVTIATGDCDKDTPRDCTESAGTTPQNTTYTNTGTGACITIDQTTLSPASYTPEIAIPTDNCFSTGEVTLAFTLSGAQITLHNVTVAAMYNGDPNVQTLITGVMRGFVSETDAQNATIDVMGMQITLDQLLPGTSTCPALHDDRDNLIPGDPKSTSGWWFYMNFEATRLLGWTPATP